MSSKARIIVVVEDSDEDYAVLTRLLRRLNVANPLHRCKDGDACLEYLDTYPVSPQEPYPALILLDLNLPGTSGREVLEQLKGDSELKRIPVTIVTTSSDVRDVNFCYNQGANSYVVKQGDLAAYQRILRHLVNYWLRLSLYPDTIFARELYSMTPSQRTILLIDDNVADRHIIKRYLQRDREHSYVFVEAETGERALTQRHAVSPDCIVMDYNLPDMNGLELLAELTGKSNLSPYPIVMMTGEGDETVAVQAIQGGAQDYLVKGSLTPEALLIAIDNAIEKARLRQNVQTQQKHLQQQNVELQQRQEEIQTLNVRLQRAMAESHHRIKNNLQTLAALVNMSTMNEPEVVPVSVLKRLELHIKTLASLHDLLTQEAKTDADFDTIDLQASLGKLRPMIQATAGERRVQITAQSVRLPLKSSSAFLLLANELLSNALKHGKGDVCLALFVEGETVHLEVTDHGPGFPAGFDALRAANTGLELIDSIARHDLRGSIAYENRPEGGGRVVVTFSAQNKTT